LITSLLPPRINDAATPALATIARQVRRPAAQAHVIVLLAAFLAAAGTPAAYATEYHWIGAGTGGITATDPADPTTQWNNPANWQEGKVPTPADKAILPLANAGYVNAQTAVLCGLRVDGPSAEGAYHIADGADVSTPTNYGVNVGLYAQGRVIQTGGSLTVGGWLRVGVSAGASGEYRLEGGTLNELTDEYIGYLGTGVFTQTGGTHIVSGKLQVGNYVNTGPGALNISGGDLEVSTLLVDYTGNLRITDPAAYIEVHSLNFGGKFSAVPGSTVHIPGTIFKISCIDESGLAGLENVAIVFDGTWSGLGGTVEVAGKDLGPILYGFKDNFAIGSLVIGGAVPRSIWLQDAVDNGNRTSAEALYVHNITVAPGSSLDLAGLKVYYDGALVNQGMITGGTPQFVPEPGTLCMLLVGLGTGFLTRILTYTKNTEL